MTRLGPVGPQPKGKKPVKKTLAIAVSVLAVTAGLAACSSSSGSGGKDTVSLMVGGLDKQIYLPFKLAQSLGFYKDAGVNVTLQDEPSGVNAETARLCVSAGATALVAGNAVFKGGPGAYAANISALKG